jgi:transcriptional regulator with XRE-family HTH domain
MKKNLKRIGENIRAARKSKNLTIETLSELAEISESFLGTVERGESSISIETLVNLCTVLDVSADSLIMYGKESTPALSDKRDTLLTMLKNATEEELCFLIDYVKLYRGRIKFQSGHLIKLSSNLLSVRKTVSSSLLSGLSKYLAMPLCATEHCILISESDFCFSTKCPLFFMNRIT